MGPPTSNPFKQLLQVSGGVNSKLNADFAFIAGQKMLVFNIR